MLPNRSARSLVGAQDLNKVTSTWHRSLPRMSVQKALHTTSIELKRSVHDDEQGLQAGTLRPRSKRFDGSSLHLQPHGIQLWVQSTWAWFQTPFPRLLTTR